MHQLIRPRRLLTAAVAGVGAVAVGVCCAVPAHAGPPGTWTTLGSTGIQSITQPTTARVGATLTVGWTVDQGTTQAIQTRTVSAAGAAGATRTAVSGWSTLSFDPKLLPDGSGRQLLFGGMRTINPGEQYDGHRIYRATAGTSWALSPALTFPDSPSASSGYGYGAVELPGGRTVVAYSFNGVIYLADDAGHTNHLNVPGTTSTYNTSLVRDSASGAVWVVVYLGDSSSTATTRTGVWAQRFDMTSGLVPVGGWTRLPGSVTHNQYGWNAINLLQDLPVASPSGGGAYVAYAMGYPTTTHIRVQRLGSSSGFTVKAKGGDPSKLSLASSGAKLWLSWAKTGNIWAARSNAAKTGLGALRHLGTPGKGASVYQLASDGATGRLDLVLTSQAFPKPLVVSHTQVLAGLTVRLSPQRIKSAKGGKEKVTVTDAGVAVAGAKVKIGSQVKRTNAKGKVTFKVKSGSAKGRYQVLAKAGGYAKATAKFKVT